MNRADIIAHLNLHAVLPRLEDLVRLDEEARQIAEELNLALQFRVRGGPFLRLIIGRGRVQASPAGFGLTDLGLFFPSSEALNRSFGGEKVTPVPYLALWKLRAMKRFDRLTRILTRYLQPEGSDLVDPRFRARAVELQLLTGLGGVDTVAQHDPLVRTVLGRPKDGAVAIQVLPDGPQACVSMKQGRARVTAGPADRPDATITFGDVDTAAALLSGELDVFASLGTGAVRISGLLPLADDVNWMLDRVGHYLA